MRIRYYSNIAMAGMGVLVLHLLLQPGAWAAQGYTLQDMSVGDTVKASGPNLSGQAAMRSGFVSARGFLSTPAMAAGAIIVPAPDATGGAMARGTADSLGQLPGGDQLTANGINDAGIVVGSANTTAGTRPCRNALAGTPPPTLCPVSTMHAVMWTKSGGLQDLGALPGDTASEAYAINNAGAVVGYSSGAQGMRAFLWTPQNGFKTLGTLPGGNFSKAFAISDNGTIVGSSGSLLGTHAVLWTANGIQDLGTLTADITSEALAVNNRGSIVGYSSGPVGMRPFLWTASSGMQALDPLPGSNLLGRAHGISDKGEVVGSSGSFHGAHAVLWSASGVPQDLNTLVLPPPGIVLMQAVGINAQGQILILGRDQSDIHGYHEGPNRSFLLTRTGP